MKQLLCRQDRHWQLQTLQVSWGWLQADRVCKRLAACCVVEQLGTALSNSLIALQGLLIDSVVTYRIGPLQVVTGVTPLQV